MRKFWVEFLVVILFMIFVIVVTDLFYLNYPTQAYVRIEKNKADEHSEIIYIGNSHIGVFDRECFGDNCSVKNLSFTGITYSNIATLLTNFTSKNTKLVIIGMEYDMFYREPNAAIEMELFPYVNKDNILQNKYSLLQHSSFYRSGRDLKWLFLSRESIIKIHESDFIPQAHAISSDELCKTRAVSFSYFGNKDYKAEIDKNHTILYSIIETLNQQKIKVALILTPKKKCYYNHYDKTTQKMGSLLIDKLSKQTKTPFFDFTKNDIDDSYFADYDHLNKKGVQYIIKELNKSLEDSLTYQK